MAGCSPNRNSLKGLKSHLFRSTQLFFGYSTRRVPTDALVGDILWGFFFFLVFCFLKPFKIGGLLGLYQFPVDWGRISSPKKLTTNHHGFRPRKITRRMREKQLGRGVLPESGRWPPGGSTPDVLEWQGYRLIPETDVTDVPV